MYHPATRPTRPRQVGGGIGLVPDQSGLAFLDAARELLLDRGADHLRAVGGEQHGRLTRLASQHVARADEDAEDGAGPRGPHAAFLQGQSRLFAPVLGRLQLVLRATDLDLDILGLQLGQSLGLGSLQGLQLPDLLLADGSVGFGDDDRLGQPLLAGQYAAGGGHAAVHGIAHRLLLGDPHAVQLGLLPRLAQLQLGQQHGRLRLGQPAAGDPVFQAQQLRSLGDLLVLGDQHLGHPTRLERVERGHSVLEVHGAEADDTFMAFAGRRGRGRRRCGRSRGRAAEPDGGGDQGRPDSNHDQRPKQAAGPPDSCHEGDSVGIGAGSSDNRPSTRCRTRSA